MNRYALIVFLCAETFLRADFCQAQAHYPVAATYQQQEVKKVVKDVVAKAEKEDLFFTRFLAVQLLDVPTYSAVYVPAPPAAYQQAQPVQAQQSSELREVLEVLKSFDARLRRLEGAAPVLPPVQVNPAAPVIPVMPKVPETSAIPRKPDAGTLLVTKCAACHEASVSGDRAGGITLFKGDPPVLTAAARWRQKMADAVETGRMPEMGSAYTLTSGERVALVDFLRSMR